MAKKKIAVLIRRFITTGGAERYAVEVTKRLKENFDIDVYCQECSDDLKSEYNVHLVKGIARPRWKNQWLFAEECKKACDEKQYDLIHSHERTPYYDVLTVHSPCFKGHLLDDANREKKFSMFMANLSVRKRKYLELEALQFETHPTKVVIPVSKFVENDINRCYPKDTRCYEIAYPGVDLKDFSVVNEETKKQLREKLGIDKKALLYVGTEFKRKGLAYLIESLKYLDEDCVLYVAGGGNVEPYRKMAESFGVASQVKFLGLINDVYSYYKAVDAYVIPTLSDPCPMTPLEAIASGCPTLVSCKTYAGFAEHIQNEETLLLDNPRDPKEIAEKLKRLLDPSEVKQFSQKGRKLAEGLGWDETYKSTLKAFDKFFARKSSL